MEKRVVRDEGGNMPLRITEGKLEGTIIDIKDSDVELFYRKFKGTIFSVRTNDGIEELSLPRKFSAPEKDAIRGNKILYKEERSYYSDSAGSSEGYNYSFKLLEGPHVNWEIKKEINDSAVDLFKLGLYLNE